MNIFENFFLLKTSFLPIKVIKREKKQYIFFRLSRAAAAVDNFFLHAYSLDHKTLRAEILAPGLIWANLVPCILRILKFRFLRVAS
jgi:hypothetical protein